MKVSDVMTRGVTTVAPTDSLRKAAQLMLQYEIGGFPVVDRGRLVGLISEGDFLRRVETGTERCRPRLLESLISPGRLAEEYTHAEGRKVGDIMTRDVVTIAPDASLGEAVSLMEWHGVRRLPVVEGEALVGILTRADLLHAFLTGSKRGAPQSVSDAVIRRRFAVELERQAWVPSGFAFAVENGEVDLQGVLTDERQRAALRVAAENIPGVRKVHDHLVEPDCRAAR